MSKLYLFAIGGTGSRVLYSLVNLLASGIKVNTQEIIPMIIDTDVNNGDLEKLRKIIKNYNEINEKLYGNCSDSEFQNHFFRTRIATPKELNLSKFDYGTLREMVDYNSLIASGFKNSKLLIDLLFNQSNLDMKLEKGFLGNPNVGSLVLRNIINSKGFKEFTQEFEDGDRIFIVNSIFGGTGAAGFPLLLNLFRDNNSEINNISYINDSIIGDITILPYFEVDVEKFHTGESSINSNTFISKTKAALSYYNKHIGNLINALYFVGDHNKSNYENIEGGVKQRNPNNFIEFVAALSIVDFLNFEPTASAKYELSSPTKYFEFGIEDDYANLNFKYLPGKNEEIIKPLIKFFYFSVFTTNYLEESLDIKTLVWRRELKLPNNYFKSSFIQSIYNFCTLHYYKWLANLTHKNHARRFVPFNFRLNNKENSEYDVEVPVNIDITEDNLFTLVNEIPANKVNSIFRKDRIRFNDIFTETVDKIKKRNLSNPKQNFISLMFEGISEIYNKRFNY